MMQYKAIEVFTSSEARWEGRALGEALLRFICDSKIAARCMVTHASEGCYESGEMATRKLEVLSYNLPVRIYMILPEWELERVLPTVKKMVTDGIVVLHTLQVVTHKTRNRFIPRHIPVKEAMTIHPSTVHPSTPVSEVVKLLLSAHFTGVPVVDDEHRPVGVISQGDLINRAGMPLRLCLLAESDQSRVDSFLETMSSRKASEVMSSPAVTIEEDKRLTDAVEIMMLEKRLKRLPVVNAHGKLVGILSCMDIFRLITKTSPDWHAFQEQNIQVENLVSVSEIMRQDTHTVHPRTPIEEIIGIIHSSDMRRVAVVDSQGFYQGIISDENLLAAFSDYQAGLWDYIVSKMPFTEAGRKHREFLQQMKARLASEVMDASHITVLQDATIEDAIGVMTKNDLKRLPVVDSQGRYRGMVSRESLLKRGYTQCKMP